MSDMNLPDREDELPGDGLLPEDESAGPDDPKGDRAPNEGPEPIGPGRVPAPPD